MSGSCLILSYIHFSDLSMDSPLGGLLHSPELQASFSFRRTQQGSLHLLCSKDPLRGQQPLPGWLGFHSCAHYCPQNLPACQALVDAHGLGAQGLPDAQHSAQPLQEAVEPLLFPVLEAEKSF